MVEIDIFAAQSDCSDHHGDSPRLLDNQKPLLLWSMSVEEINRALGHGLDLGLDMLFRAGSAAALRLSATSAVDPQAPRYTRDLLRLPRLAEASPTLRWVVMGRAKVWRESERMDSRPKPDSGLWSSSSSGPGDTPSVDYSYLLVLQPEANNPLQLYRMPEQRSEDSKLSLMSPHHRFQYHSILWEHLYFVEALILPGVLDELYVECARCGKAVPTDRMSDTCHFHPDEAEECGAPTANRAIPTPPNSFESVYSMANDGRLAMQYYKFKCCIRAGDSRGCTAVEAHVPRAASTHDF